MATMDLRIVEHGGQIWGRRRDFSVHGDFDEVALGGVSLDLTLSFMQRLGIKREMLVAIARSFIQLSIVGFGQGKM